MRTAYRAKRFHQATLDQIELCNQIIKEYLGQGLRLTLRQLYYQMVANHGLPNLEKSYKNLSTVVSDARLAGLMDWDAIEDRVRRPVVPNEFRDLNSLVEAAFASYRLPRWQSQDYYVELWVEKDALSGVLHPIAREYHVTMMVNRGYSSQSAMYDSAGRFAEHAECKRVLFYLGDHDPSGEDMVRDIQSRMEMFGIELEVRKLALTMTQVEQYNPPPNPAKMTDPRAGKYVDKHGDESWEVDALPPTVLRDIIVSALESVLDRRKMNRMIKMEELDKTHLREALESLDR